MLDRRTLLSSMISSVVSLPFFCKYFKTKGKEETPKFLPNNNTCPLPICIMGKYLREKRWDCITRFCQVVEKTYKDIDINKLIRHIKCHSAIADHPNIHYLSVAPSYYGYYLHVKYTYSDEILALPI